MLVLSLIVSAVLLVITNVAARGKHPLGWTLGVGIGLTVMPICIGVLLPTVALQSALLCIALLVLNIPGPEKRYYLPASLATTLIAYAITTGFALYREQEFARLREKYPIESMEKLLPTPPVSSAPTKPDNLEQIEYQIEMEARSVGTMRKLALDRLHTQKVTLFINSPGFGVARTFPVDADMLKHGQRDGLPIPQPNPGPNTSPPDKWEPVAVSGFGTLHEASVLDFVNPAGFGLFENRQRVIGFQRHGFSKVPGPEERWAVETIDLVGLLLHGEPLAYVSKNLPRMDELRAAPTRPLDSFETQGLATLRQGEELFARGSETRVRMLGAIRATKQCLDCHGGARGDLLGAFSYSLRRE
jgi:hypothetical protein